MFNVFGSMKEAQERLGLIERGKQTDIDLEDSINKLTQIRLELIKLGATEKELEELDEIIKLADARIEEKETGLSPTEETLRSFLED